MSIKIKPDEFAEYCSDPSLFFYESVKDCPYRSYENEGFYKCLRRKCAAFLPTEELAFLEKTYVGGYCIRNANHEIRSATIVQYKNKEVISNIAREYASKKCHMEESFENDITGDYLGLTEDVIESARRVLLEEADETLNPEY